jgi:formylmethanofuran dehydrogenase subunit A
MSSEKLKEILKSLAEAEEQRRSNALIRLHTKFLKSKGESELTVDRDDLGYVLELIMIYAR